MLRVVSTHADPHCVSPPSHVLAQLLRLHTSPMSHPLPQPPQLLGSLEVSTQAPAHSVKPG
jgi:hypothetical protein